MKQEKEDNIVKSRAARDPEGRRMAIVAACADLIVEEGIRKVTNRRVAERANVPLGSTTQYFKSVDALRYAGLEELANRADEAYQEIIEQMDASTLNVETYAEALITYLADPQRVQADAELYAAAINDMHVRELAVRAHASFIRACAPYLDETRLEMLMAFADGALLQTCLYGKPMAAETIRAAMTMILKEKENNE